MQAELAELVEFRCRGCRRRMGYTTTGQPEKRVFCSLVCAVDGPASENEERDALIRELGNVRRWTAQRLAGTFDVSRQRVQQILQRSRLGG